MKRHGKQVLISIISTFMFLFFIGCNIDSGDLNGSTLTTEQLLIQELNLQVIPLDELPMNLGDSSLSFMDQYGESRIIGMGEATHGTGEFFRMKHRLFRYLVEQHSYKGIAFEADFAESVYLNNYIMGAEGDLETLMNTVMHFWTWKSFEVKELLEWMRNYNANKAPNEQIVYFGIDCQSSTFQPDLMQAYYEYTIPSLWQSISATMIEIREMESIDYQSLPPQQFQEILTLLQTYEFQMESNKALLMAASSSQEYELYRQVLRTFVQAFQVRYRFETGNGDYLRDRFMADNALWAANYMGEKAKISLWAHNGHIAKDPGYFASGSMGELLYQDLDDNYRAIGFGFSIGSFNAMTENESGKVTGIESHDINSDPNRNSVNHLWHQAAYNNFVFQPSLFGEGSQWESWLDSEKQFLMIGSTYSGVPETHYRPTDIGNNYNLIIYFDTTTSSQLLPESSDTVPAP
jgi:erythromycin esterase